MTEEQPLDRGAALIETFSGGCIVRNIFC